MFSGFGLDSRLLENVKKAGYTCPTPVQASAIGPAILGQNLVVTAETGSGKTAAFALPLLNSLLKQGHADTLRGLVLCPTREVAQQVHGQIVRFSRGTGLKSIAIYGGVGYEPQFRALASGVDIIVATPGRMLDHLNRRTANLNDVSFLVLDEADRMLDMGFLPDVSKIMSELRADRQTLLFSATMPSEVLTLAKRFIKQHTLLTQEDHSAPPESLSQGVCPAAQENKVRLLVSMLKKQDPSRVLVFARTKSRAERVARQLVREGFKAAFIHGGRSQRQRDDALDGFRKGRYLVLVGTDVAGRGIDVSGVTHVVNYDLPADPTDYIHRVGRTARAGKSGHALSFVTREDRPALRDIEVALGCRIPLVDIRAD